MSPLQPGQMRCDVNYTICQILHERGVSWHYRRALMMWHPLPASWGCSK